MATSDVTESESGLDEQGDRRSSISRRALLAGTAAFAVGASASRAVAADQSGHAHHAGHAHHHGHDGSGDHTALVRAAGDCQIAGEICQAHCQMMLATGDTSLAECSASVRDMMAGCSSLMQMAASNSKYLPGMAKLCSQILEDCEKQCKEHADHKECKACAQACADCLEECKKVMA